MFDENCKPNKGAIKAKPVGKTIEETYTKKTQLEHILLRPDTYVGSVEKQTQQMWVFDSETKLMEFKQITFVPGLYKIFDEIIVNAADNKQRDNSMNRIEVTINVAEGSIRVWNNGRGIPVVIHGEHKIYVPELIFGNLLTGSNFNDQEEKTTGGRNGYGAKLTNIFSKKFIVETMDSEHGLKYRQEFSNNMSTRAEPVIAKSSQADFTAITFFPDLERFKMDELDADIVALLSKRVYDVAGTNANTVTADGKSSKLSVYLNGEKIDVKSFEQYVGLYKGLEPPVAFERISDRWEIGVGISDGTFQQVSFVNSISTTKGGCHVAYIADQITARLGGTVKKRNKNEEVKPNQIKNHLAVYVNCLVVNPAFDSQTKETLTTKASAFGSSCVVSDRLMKLVEKSGVVDNILSWAKFKQTNELKKKSGSKRSKLIGIPKLDDANCAGTAKSNDCTLILTEGDSAKALAISGLGVVGRDYYGVFPLKGKLLNVREASHAQMMKNEEIQNLTKILGLTFGKTYEDASALRYGHLMIMADQDHDGSHIKGLLINFLHHFWPSLLKINGFLQQFITPIVKCSRGKKEETFFTIPEYQAWRAEHDEGRGWKIKYYKGLGTSTAAEAKEYFSNLQTHEVDFAWDDRADDMIDMAFAKKRVEDRKTWLLSMEPGVHIDYSGDSVSYDNFVNHELILFSHADNERSIPHYMDGLKPSQRKVLFACFKRNLRQEIKVAQLAGYISEHSAYHHGEASLTQTIIGMAQNFVGSNNINLLSPCGQFGTRLMGGKDAASPRYVFTKLQSITRCIYHADDDPLLDYLDDDGQSIEPRYYVPVIPMALVNGSDGIGTGWSSSIPTYDPRAIIANLRLMIEGREEEVTPLEPWFRGFTGGVQAKTGKDCNNFTVSGAIEVVDETTVVISELPVGKWTTDYKQFLESVLLGTGGAAAAAKEKDKEGGGESGPAPGAPFVKDFKENHTDTTVLFTVTLPAEKLSELMREKGGLMKKFKLDGSVATSNMHMFDLSSQIQKFDGPMEVMREFYKIRLMYYDKRKLHLCAKLADELDRLENKMRFIRAVIKGSLVVSGRKKADIVADLTKQGFKAFADKKATAKESGSGGDSDSQSVNDEEGETAAAPVSYDYLLSMKIWSLTMEKVAELQAQCEAKQREVEELRARSAESLWVADLDALEDALLDFEGEIDAEKKKEAAARKKAKNDKANKGKSGAAGKSGARTKKRGSAGSDSEGDDVDDGDDSDFEEEKRRKTAAAAAKKKAAASKPVAAKAATAPASKPISDFFKPASAAPSAAGAKKLAPAVVERESSSSSAAAVPVAAVKSKMVTMTMSSKPLSSAPDEFERETMSLADRLKASAAANREKAEVHASSAAPSSTVNKTLFATKSSAPSKQKAAAKPAEKKTASSSVTAMNLCSDDEDDDLFGKNGPLSAPAISRPARVTAAVKKSYVVDSEEEEDDDDASASDDNSEEEDCDDFCSDSDTDFGASKKKSKPAAKAAATTAAAKKPVAAAKTVKSSAAAPSLKTTPVKKGIAGVKRAAKSAVDSSPVAALYSPAPASPKATKKAKVVLKAAATSKTTAAKSAAVKKAVPQPKKKRVVESDEDEEFSENGSDHEAPARIGERSPKPSRARKPTSFAAMYATEDSSCEEDEDEEFSD